LRLLLIGIASVVLFFPTWWVLYPKFGPDWSIGVAVFMTVLGYPILFLHHWRRSTNPIIKAGNYALAMLVLVVLLDVAYSVVFEGAPVRDAFPLLLLFGLYGGIAGYFIRRGHMPWQAEEVAGESDGDKST